MIANSNIVWSMGKYGFPLLRYTYLSPCMFTVKTTLLHILFQDGQGTLHLKKLHNVTFFKTTYQEMEYTFKLDQ